MHNTRQIAINLGLNLRRVHFRDALFDGGWNEDITFLKHQTVFWTFVRLCLREAVDRLVFLILPKNYIYNNKLMISTGVHRNRCNVSTTMDK